MSYNYINNKYSNPISQETILRNQKSCQLRKGHCFYPGCIGGECSQKLAMEQLTIRHTRPEDTHITNYNSEGDRNSAYSRLHQRNKSCNNKGHKKHPKVERKHRTMLKSTTYYLSIVHTNA